MEAYRALGTLLGMTAERIQALTAQLLRAENPEVADAVVAELQAAIAQYLAIVRIWIGDSIPLVLDSTSRVSFSLPVRK